MTTTVATLRLSALSAAAVAVSSVVTGVIVLVAALPVEAWAIGVARVKDWSA